MTLFGTDVRRVEDHALLTGSGRFVADLDLPPGALCVVYVTSQMAHALLRSVDIDDARAMPGVVDIVTHQDLDVGPYPSMNPDFPAEATRPLLATDRVRFVGEAIAAVVAETQAQAQDAAELVMVDYDPLDPAADLETALRGEVLLYEGRDDNVVIELSGGDAESHVDDCEVVIEQTIISPRIAPCPIEGRVSASYWEGDKLVHYSACQGVHPIRTLIAGALGLDIAKVRVISPEVGGSFGAKSRSYPEEVLLPWLSQRLGKPMRWIPQRSVDMVGLGHSRAQIQKIRIGGRGDGTIEAMDAHIITDGGAYPMIGALLGRSTGTLMSQLYKVPHIHWTMQAIATNTTPTVAYRGAGRPESGAMVERAVDLFAAKVDVDPAEVRRINFIQPDEFPYTTPTGLDYDTGEYPKMLATALEAVDYDRVRDEQARRREAGDAVQLGIGIGCFIDRTAGVAGSEYAGIELREDGTVLVRTGSNPYGQGHHTGWKMLVADRTGLDMDRVEVVHGDTDVIPRGGITGGSKSVQKFGSAVALATEEMVDKARRLAADLLEANVDDIVLDLGTAAFSVVGTPARALTWGDLAGAGLDERTGLACEADFDGDSSYPAGAYVAVAEVDTETGGVQLRRFVSVDDAGNILNPLLALGQAHGALAQGIGQALTEEMVYDADGNPLTANLADYGLISSAELPSFDAFLQMTPTPNNPLGAKGIAESGTIGAPPAVQNAVVDAVRHLGVDHIDMPCTPQRVWTAISAATR